MSSAVAHNIPAITRITSKLIRILGCNPGPMTLQGTNTYLLGNGKRRILLDTGEPGIPDYIGHLKTVLKEENATINNIILSHWHNDHIGGVRDVLQVIENAHDCRVWKYPRTDAPDEYDALKDVDVKYLADGQEIVADGAKVKVVHTPGHTTDHCILFMNETEAVFSGDCILGEGTAVFEDLYEYMKSLEQILSIKPTVIYPGHGNIIKDPVPKIQYYIDHRNKREQQIMAVFSSHPDTWQSDMDLVEIIYAETPRNLWPAAASNVNQHLSKLKREKRIVDRTEDDRVLWKLLNTPKL